MGRIARCLGFALLVVAVTAGWAQAEIVRDANGRRLGVTPRLGIAGTSLPGALAAVHASSLTASQSSAGTLVWNGGPVLHSSAPYLLFWTPGGEVIPNSTQSLLARYFTDVAADSGTASNVYGVARQYTDATGFADYRQTFGPSQVVTDTGSYPANGCPYTSRTYSHCFTDTQLEAELQRELAAAGLPADGAANAGSLPANAPVYFVVLPTDVNVCYAGGGHYCADNALCAFHSSFVDSANNDNVIYAAIPTIILGQNPKSCQADGNPAIEEPNGTSADVVVKYMSHEDNEAITDPLTSAWYDPVTQNENGDNCNAYGLNSPANGTSLTAFTPTLGGSPAGTLYNQLINSHPYYVQSEWSNGDAGCQMRPASPPPTATFTTALGTIPPATTTTFDPGASTSNGGFSSATWSFGDGSAPIFNRASRATSQVTHSFAADGTYGVTLTLVDTHGNLSTTTRQVVVDEPPTAAFTVTTQTPGSGQPTTFDGSASSDPDGSIDTYTWNFGDGTTTTPSTSATASHTYQVPGTYTVTLQVKDGGLQIATTSHTVIVAGPTPAFSSTPVMEGGVTTLDGSASTDSQPGATIASYTWNFGDGTTETYTTPLTTYQYAHYGTYWITLTLTDSNGFTSSVSQQIQVADEPPVSSFQVTASPGSGLPTNFDASASSDSDGTVTSYSWDFGDGNTATTSTPTTSHAYANPGSYTVKLTVTDSDGATATSTQNLTVGGPTASVTGPSQGLDNTPVTFDGSHSSAGPGNFIQLYSWSADDGWTATGATVSHAFSQPGLHNVTLTVQNDMLQTATTTVQVNVQDETPTAAISVVSAGVLATGEQIAFDGRGSSDSDGAITSYAWNFGDGITSTGATPAHAYQSAGTYTVTLVVTDSSGQQSAPITQRVTVHALPVGAFWFSPGQPLEGTSVHFDASGSANPEPGVPITGWAWRFGDGGTASGAAPAHTFAKPGTYSVTLTLTNALGLSSSTTQLVTVHDEPPAASFAVRTPRPSTGVPVSFAGSGSDLDGGISSYAWNFRDGGSATVQNPSHVFRHPGVYTVTLTVTDTSGQHAQFSQQVTVALSGRITHLKLQGTPTAPILLVTVNTGGMLQVGAKRIRVTRPGTLRVRLRLSARALHELSTDGVLRLHTSLTFAPFIGPSSKEPLTIIFRPTHTRLRYRVVLLHP